MADNQKYYYLKLKDNFFDSEKVLLLEAMPDGIIFSNILLKLYLKSLKHGGRLCLDENVPYTDEMLATVIRQPITMLKHCLKALVSLGLIEQLHNGTFYMTDIELFVGKSSTEGDRKRLARMNLEGGQSSDIRPPEIEKEKEKEIELEKELDTLRRGRFEVNPTDELPLLGKYENVFLTKDDFDVLKNEFSNYLSGIEKLSEYMASTGKSYKNHLATIRLWAKNDLPTQKENLDYSFEEGECL